MPVANLFGIPIQIATMAEVLERVDDAISTRQSLDIGVVNAAKVVNMRSDPELAKAMLNSDAIYADGMSVVWASRVLGKPLPERIAGIDLMHSILQQGQPRKYRVFCLGASPEILDKVCETFDKNYSGIEIVGSNHGYFDKHKESQIATSIRDSQPDVLFVAMTSPKKERFIARWSTTMNVPVVHGVGGSFDVVAGLVDRAPDLMQRLGLEWLYRVIQEPRRLWRRYLYTNMAFLSLVIKDRFHMASGTPVDRRFGGL